MLSENRAERNQMEFFCIDSFVPEDHLLRKIDDAVDFGKIYEIVGDLYCRNNGRPSVDPVVLFKIVFIRNCQKTVLRHIWEEYMELVEDYRHTPENQALYAQRKETVERVFADAKEKHGMRYTPYRGLAQVTKWVRLKFAALNLKKLAIHLRKDRRLPLFYAVYIRFPCRKSVFA